MEAYVPNTKYHTILIIESNAAFGERLSGALKKEGYKTILIKSGSQGFDAILNNKCDLIVLDVILSGTDGYKILQQKQANALVAHVPVFLLSIQGIQINMNLIPAKSVAEFSVSAHPDVVDIVSRINLRFGYTKNDGNKAPQSEVSEPSVDSRKKILWVEDDKLIGTILGKKIITSGFNLLHATNGEDALKAVKNFIPDIIVLDLVLPGISGFDILRKIKTDSALSKIPVMILSNLSKPSDIEKAKMLGVQRFFVKAALSLDQIIEEINNMIK